MIDSIKMKALIVTAYLLLVTASFVHAQITIAANGKSAYHIVTSANATAIETEAAKVLQTYLQTISACQFPITTEAVNTNAKQIIVGKTTAVTSGDIAGLREDGLLIKKAGSSLIITGGSRKGTLYGVYTFLETYLNCKTFTKDDIVIPPKSTIVLPSNIYIKQIPSFYYRMSCFVNLSKPYCDFNKQNYFSEDWGLFVHSFNLLLPPGQYFASHPEYYALINGKRVQDQPCLSNPEVLKIVINNLGEKIKQTPTAKYWSVSQNDNQQFCQCDNCKRTDSIYQSHQGTILTFVNKVAQRFPDKTISTLAYQYSEKPPVGLLPVKNVMIMLCSINEERRTPIANHTKNDFKNHLQDWTKLTTNLFIWDYVAQFSNSFSPFPNLYTLQPNIQYFASQKIRYMFEEGICDQTHEFSELRTYLISKLLWNKDADVKKEMTSFITGFYGTPAASYIISYINQLNANAAKSNASLSSFASPANQRNTFLTTSDINNYKKIFANALTATDAGSQFYKRITKEYLSVLFSELEINKITANKTPSDKRQNKALLDDFVAKAKSADVTSLNEGRRSVQDYYNEYIKLLQ